MYIKQEVNVFNTDLLKVGCIVKVTEQNKQFNGMISNSEKDKLEIVTIRKFGSEKDQFFRKMIDNMVDGLKDFESSNNTFNNKYIPEIKTYCISDMDKNVTVEVLQETYIKDE